MSSEQDIAVCPDKTRVSPLEDTLKIRKVFREGIHNWEEDNKRFQGQIGAQSISELAGAWSIVKEALRRLGIGFDTNAYTFPMRNWQGKIVGFRKRSYKDIRRKYVARDSAQGLFIPEGVTPGNLQIIAEGESDVAVALSAGFGAIGVPSAGAAVDDVIGFAGQSPVACPCIIGDNDAAGTSGADKLAEGLLKADIPCRVLIVSDPYGDLRDWINKGKLTPKALANAITAQKVVYPDKWPSNFFMVPNALIRRGVISRVGPAAYAVLAAIASFSDSNGVCRATRDELSELIGQDVRTIDRCKGILKDAALLSWKPGRTGRANEYRVNVGPCKRSTGRCSIRPALSEKKT